MKKILSLLFCILFLNNCSFTPDYERPASPVSDNWNNLPPPNSGLDELPMEAARLSWQEYFSSPQLKILIKLALQNNRDLRIAMLNVEATQERYGIERAQLFPVLSADMSSSRQKITKAENRYNAASPNRETISSRYTANLATSFELDLFGKLRSLNEAALQTFFATKAAHDVARITLIASVSTAYFQWWADTGSLKLLEDTQDTQEKTLSLITKKYELGTASRLELAQARSALEKTKADQELFRRLVTQDKNTLVLLTGIKQNEFPFETPTLAESAVTQELMVNLSSKVLLLRPDIQQAEHELKSANALIGNARASFFPTISLTGSYGFASNELSDLFSRNATGSWSFIPRLSLPIFQGGSLIAKLRYSEAQKKIAVAQYEKAIQTAFKEVADALVAKRTLADQAKTYQHLLAAAKEAYTISHARYKEGIDSFLILLDAQRTLLEAQQGEIDIKRQSLVNFVDLYKSLGGGQETCVK